MGAFTSKQFVRFEFKQIGDSNDHWTRDSCPAPYTLTDSKCTQIVDTPATSLINCEHLTGCQGFDWDPTVKTVSYHQQASSKTLQPSNNITAFVYEDQYNWPLIVGIIFGVILVVLIIWFLVLAVRSHSQIEAKIK